MLSFELSAIDLILAIAVVTLFIMYITKFENIHPNTTSFFKKIKINKKKQKETIHSHQKYEECPRGFGKIKRVGEDNSVSERCLGCYRIMECYEQKQ